MGGTDGRNQINTSAEKANTSQAVNNMDVGARDEDDNEQNDGPAVRYEELETAAFYNNQDLILDWLESSKDQQNPQWRGRLLRRAAYYHSVDVVRCIMSFKADFDDVNHLDQKGKTPLHHAAEGSGQADIKPANLTKDLLDIIGDLFNNGADPTVKCKMGRTPRDIAIQNDFKLGAALFEILECIWLKDNVSVITDNKNDKICLHKELLQWAVENQHEKIVMCILQMNNNALAADQSCTETVKLNNKLMSTQRTQFLLGTIEGLYTKSLFHVAVNTGNMDLLQSLILCSGLALNVLINLRWRKFSEHTQSVGVAMESGQTPLSLALSNASYCDFIEVFLKLQSEGDLVTHIDLSYTRVDCPPRELFNLNCISNLNISNNTLTNLSKLFEQFYHGRFARLSDVDLSNNNLSSLPIELFRLPVLKNLDVSNNPLDCLPEWWWMSKSLVKLNASVTHLTEICTHSDPYESLNLASLPSTHATHSDDDDDKSDNICRQLKEIDISSSHLESFPKYLACYFPNLMHLNISHNKITSCCAVNELPALLEELDISHNNLQSEGCSIFHLSTKEDTSRCYLYTKLDHPLRCSHMSHSNIKNLRVLNLAENINLQKLSLHYDDLTASNSACLFFPRIKKLILNNCGLSHVPLRLSRLSKIYHLDIGNNTMNVPREICTLEQLSTFIYDGLPDPIVADLNKFTSIKEKQIFLLQENAKHAPSLKLMLVGLSGRGKSTLLSHLKYTGKTKTLPVTLRQRLESMNVDSTYNVFTNGSYLENVDSDTIQSTVGIDQDLWCYAKNMDQRGISNTIGITFYVWDFAGQEEYSAAHQCFITENSLYVLCWRACDGEEGILELKDWLLTIKARAKSAVVVIVGTHIDKVKRFRLEKKKIYTDKIIELYNKSCYPTIKKIRFVCCDTNSKKYPKHKDKITELRDTLYDVASEMKLSLGESRRFEQNLTDMKIPENFLKLQERIHFEANYFKLHREKGPPILTWNKILELGKDCGFKEENETAVAIKYAKDQGRLMHFDLSTLKDLYFVDSQWLCDMFAHVVSSEFNRDFTVDGKANRQALELSLMEKFKIPKHYMGAIIKLLSKFELVIPLDGNTFLIPSLLQSRKKDFSRECYSFPRNKNTDTLVKFNRKSLKSPTSSSSLNYCSLTDSDSFSVVAHHRLCTKEVTLHSTGMCYRRIFVADYVPINFWPRLITRFLSSAESFHKIICHNCFSNVCCENFVEVGNASIGSLPCSWSYDKYYVMLKLGDDVILRVNSLYGFNNVGNKRERIPISHSVSKLKTMYIYYDDVGNFMPVNVDDGFEVTIPDYIVHSGPNTDSLTHESKLMSAQILSHVLETIDEVLKGWFEGLMEQGIYSDKYLTHFIPCPYCFGDTKPDSMLDASLEPELYGDPCNIMLSTEVPNGLVGFSLQHCLYQARRSNFIKCTNRDCGEKLSLKCLVPDLVFEDKKFTKINEKLLKIERQQLGKGGYGAVYKAKYLKEPSEDVALKFFTTANMKNLTLQELCQVYADARSEFNKLISVDHCHIVNCIGFCVMSLSFVLELAPRGSLKNIIEKHRKTGYYLCPNSLVETVKQVSLALDYLHTKKLIVHYDIKPDNILVFHFPTVGHDCFAEKCCNFMCTFCKDDQVEVKLADLGISAFVGPRGFHRKPATPAHTAPEAIKYAGKEPLSEKVDIFSLGITLYEQMTLQLLPPHDVYHFDFDSDIKDGIRPPFIDEVPNYPLYPAIIKELVVNCWAQEYTARPSAQEIVSILQSPDCLKLSNAYNTELPYSAVSAALVVTVDDQQSLWLAHSIDGQHKVTVYGFYGLPDLYKPKHNIDMKIPVLGMCQAGVYVLLALKHGTLVAVSTNSFQIEYQMELELERDDLVQMLSLNDHAERIVLAYKDGTVAYVSCLKFGESDAKVEIFDDDVLNVVKPKRGDETSSIVKVSSSQLYAVEVCKPQNRNQVELWCGCDNNLIKIYISHDGSSQAQLKTELNAHCSSKDSNIPQDASIIQLKSSFNAAAHMMYALHSCDSVISCWSVCEQPALNNVIKLTQLSSPANQMFSLIRDTLIITDDNGKVYQLRLNHASDGDGYTCEQLPSSHQPGKMMHLFRLLGRMSTKGSLFCIGSLTQKTSSQEHRDYVNIAVKSFPCVVLLGLRAGYRMLQVKDGPCPSLYFTTWPFPDDSNLYLTEW